MVKKVAISKKKTIYFGKMCVGNKVTSNDLFNHTHFFLQVTPILKIGPVLPIFLEEIGWYQFCMNIFKVEIKKQKMRRTVN